MLARIARARLPEPSTTASPVTRSPATARNGIASWSKSVDLRRAQRLARDDHVDDLALHEPDRQLELAVVQTRAFD